MLDVMLDIESLATSKRAVILSVGLVEFELHGPAGLHKRPFFGKRQRIVPHVLSQLLTGRDVDPATVKFWQEQSGEARRHFTCPNPSERMSAHAAATAIYDFCRKAPSEKGTKRIWAHGITFDLTNVEDFVVEAGFQRPWEYNSPRDCWTIAREFPKVRTRPDDWSDGWATKHEPVYDCMDQIWDLWERWPCP
jgi:hypothetical protein